MRIKWSTVHAQFSQFNGRPNTRGGFDWNFNRHEWLQTLKILNMGVSEQQIHEVFDFLDNGTGLVDFQLVQEVLLFHSFVSQVA